MEDLKETETETNCYEEKIKDKKKGTTINQRSPTTDDEPATSKPKENENEHKGVSDATVHEVTIFLWSAIGNVNYNYCGTAPNVSGMHER
ncbi:hypothetical protein FQA39_LY12720 [Lamprigera yunnana]|nr:hypothetical protein FQA39_LY12720 [Lamprigera yunnana]